MDNIIATGKQNVFNYSVKLVDLNQDLLLYCMEIQEYYRYFIMVKQEVYVMMALMNILLKLLATNYTGQVRQLLDLLMDNNVILMHFG
jgi:hypothetical protein